MCSTYVLELVELRLWFVRGLVRPSLHQYFLEPSKDLLFVQLVSVILETLYELLDRTFRLERKQ